MAKGAIAPFLFIYLFSVLLVLGQPKERSCDVNANHDDFKCALLVVGHALFYAQPGRGRAVSAL